MSIPPKNEDQDFCKTGGSCEISREIDSIWCSRQCARVAKNLGFSENDLWEICIAASELVTNVLKYAGTGRMTVRSLSSNATEPEIELVVEDSGPGIDDIETALIDGVSEGQEIVQVPDPRLRRGLGAGLGAVQRLMDKVTIENKTPSGVVVTARKKARTARKR